MASSSFVEQLGYLFYIASSKETFFETPEEVPDYAAQVIPHFFLLIFLENCLLFYKKKRISRLNDAVVSISQGVFQQLAKLVILDMQLVSYAYIYENWRLATLPWDSPWTWFLCFLGTDFCYYWLHRASHEINILWAAHQVHHSSEDYNLSTALRRSVLQDYCVWIINLPLALAIPPSVFLVHTQLNLLFQFWIHTETVTKLGPLEYILNTASHHRVHHGRNRYCIDKNYAGVLIIWDRMFGTFEPEKEEVVYGLTHPINSFEIFYVQFCHYIHIWKTFWATEGFWNKLSVLVKGPGWSPGTPWHGNVENIPDVGLHWKSFQRFSYLHEISPASGQVDVFSLQVKAPVEKFDPPLPLWCKAYAFFHLLVLSLGYFEVANNAQSLSRMILWNFVLYEVFSLSILGLLLEGRLFAQWIELVRCSLYVIADYFLLYSSDVYKVASGFQLWVIFFLRTVFIISFIFWLQYCLRSISVKMHSSKLKKSE